MALSRKHKYFLLFCIIFLIVGISSLRFFKKLPESKPKDFNFVFNYGIDGKNQLDTAAGKFTQDMIVDPSLTTDLKLTQEEMDSIYAEMKAIDILHYPRYFKPFTMAQRSSFATYTIRITYDGKEKTITWKDKNLSSADDAAKLRELFSKILEIIRSKEEYKKLPNPRGGYL